jgi:glycine dehydrogenase subunit 1
MAHPFMPNSVAEVQREMLAATGASSVSQFFEQIPSDHRLQRPLDLPPQLASEAELRRHLQNLLNRTTSCEESLSFLGSGTYRHHVPSICDEITGRYEWLTSVMGTPSSDQGRYQAWFEWASQLGELLVLDFIGLPVYSWGCAAGHALRMAARLTQRRTVLVTSAIDPQRLAVITNYCGSESLEDHLRLVMVKFRASDGQLDLEDLKSKLDGDVAALYFENPNFFGVIEEDAEEIAGAVAAVGAEIIAGVDPITLGVLVPPGELGIGMAVGSIQTMGVHMNAGGGVGGFIASRDEDRYAREYPTLQVSICDTIEPGELGFAEFLMEQTSYGAREQGNDWTGNSTHFWTIANAAFMAIMGPEGFHDVGTAIIQRSHYAAARLAEIPKVSVRFAKGFIREFVVDFNDTGQSVDEINSKLREQGIFGGLDLSGPFPEFGQSALYCITELHSQAEIERLVGAITEVVR